jgi:hypothetical protein
MRYAMAAIFCLTLCAGATADRTLISDTFDFQGEWLASSGTWETTDGELYQLDAAERIATVTRIVRQSGELLYEFDLRYLKGFDDGYGGFGIHILIDAPTGLRSWGQNASYLLWITHDMDEYKTPDLHAHVYRSTGITRMDYHRMEGDEYRIPPAILSVAAMEQRAHSGEPIRVRFLVDTVAGTGMLYHPDRNGVYYDLDFGTSLGGGSYIALRTNSLSVAFDNVTVTRLD